MLRFIAISMREVSWGLQGLLFDLWIMVENLFELTRIILLSKKVFFSHVNIRFYAFNLVTMD